MPARSIPGFGQPYAGPRETSGKAIASLICGICFLIFPAAVAAIILGHLSLSDIKSAAGRLTGKGMATAGLVLGYFGVVGLIPFVLIIAAILIPNLLRARMAANEASAVGSVRTIEMAAFKYRVAYDNGFPPSLIAMDGVEPGSPSCEHAHLINSVLATGQKNGYIFEYVPTGEQIAWADAKSGGCGIVGTQTYNVHADPITRGTTGMRSFYTDQTGVIRFEMDRPAASDSPPLGE